LEGPRAVNCLKCNWVNYSKEFLTQGLSETYWSITDDAIQGFWNQLEKKIFEIIDKIARIQNVINSIQCNTNLPRDIKQN
jgi:hypothetical protein